LRLPLRDTILLVDVPPVIQIFGTRKCRDTQKALRFFKDRGIGVQFRDILGKAPSPGELDDVAKAVGGFAKLVDADEATWRSFVANETA
jgi:arsenate reductase-like glutaredoxin family protein